MKFAQWLETLDPEQRAHANLQLGNKVLADCHGELTDRDHEEYGKEDCTNLDIAAAAVVYAYAKQVEHYEELARLARQRMQGIKRNYAGYDTQANAGRAAYCELQGEYLAE